jgi:transcriptional regulator with XRE-family HTH domain
MFIGDNLKMLRKRAGKSQEDIANELGFNRSTYSGYENGVAQPNIENLIIFSQFYSLTIDQLLKLNLVDFKESDWLNLEQSWQEKASGSNLRILTSQVDEHNEELVEIVTLKASAGYLKYSIFIKK